MESDDDVKSVEQLHQAHERLRRELAKVVVGQEQVVEQMLTVLFAGGHCLLVGVPGLAKTLLVRTLAQSLSLEFSRVQFTPDLMPADITGTEVIQEDRSSGERTFRFLQGPVFANVLLADEVNRTPPKTQAALLEAMQEGQVTVGGQRHPLPDPFFVLATQNPIEQEGTYPLPEAQLDRFMYQVLIDYPAEDEELEIVQRTTADFTPQVTATLAAEQIRSFSQLVRRIPVADHLARYALAIVRQSRPDSPQATELINRYVSWGAGPRASQFMVLAAKARAALHGRLCVGKEDIETVAAPVLRHRLIVNFNAEADGVSSDTVIAHLLERTSVPQNGEA